MNAYPLKKRRGRPPKYLNVWHQQFISSMNGEGVILDSASIGTKNKMMVENTHTRVEQYGGTCDSDPPFVLDSIVATERNQQASPSLQTDLYTACKAATKDMPPPISPVPSTTSEEDVPSTPSEALNETKTPEEENSFNLQANPIDVHQGTEQPTISSVVRVKRRPGRPPGSTKKAKLAGGSYMKTSPIEEEFTLRRFFEAGGRDYNKYLDYLKQKKANVNSASLSPHPGLFPPFYPMTLPGVRMMIQSQNFPTAFPLPNQIPVPIGPRSPVVALTPPAVYRHNIPFMQESAAHPVGLPCLKELQERNYSQMHKSPQSNNPETLRPMSSVQASKQEHNNSEALESETCILDLSSSSSRRRTASESEKENGTVPEKISHKKFRYNKDILQGNKSSSVIDQENNSEMQSSENDSKLQSNMLTWDVEHVADFVSSLPECREYAEIFRSHRIDGATLPHLSDDHLLNHVGMKLGHMIRLKLAVKKLTDHKSH